MVPVEVSLSPLTHEGTEYVIAAVRNVSDRIDDQGWLTLANEQALAGERARIGRDLRDVVLQHLYGMGLSVQAIAVSSDGSVKARLEVVLGNVARHAQASRVVVTVEVSEGHVVMKVADNGTGPPQDLARAYSGGHGLANLRSRAAALGGSCALTAGRDQGAVLMWTVPFH